MRFLLLAVAILGATLLFSKIMAGAAGGTVREHGGYGREEHAPSWNERYASAKDGWGEGLHPSFMALASSALTSVRAVLFGTALRPALFRWAGALRSFPSFVAELLHGAFARLLRFSHRALGRLLGLPHRTLRLFLSLPGYAA